MFVDVLFHNMKLSLYYLLEFDRITSVLTNSHLLIWIVWHNPGLQMITVVDKFLNLFLFILVVFFEFEEIKITPGKDVVHWYWYFIWKLVSEILFEVLNKSVFNSLILVRHTIANYYQPWRVCHIAIRIEKSKCMDNIFTDFENIFIIWNFTFDANFDFTKFHWLFLFVWFIFLFYLIILVMFLGVYFCAKGT